MPYPGQSAGKIGHSDLLNNPEVQAFLGRCEDIPRPSAKDVAEMVAAFPRVSEIPGELPRLILAIDGSTYESAVDGRYPSRRIGYVKISSVILDMDDYASLRATRERFIDPIEVARLQKETDTISMALPGAYVKPEGAASVADGFRRELLRYFRSSNTVLGGETLYDTLVDLIRLLQRVNIKANNEYVLFGRCPNEYCEKHAALVIEVPVDEGFADCLCCSETVYVTDALRIYETFIENGSNTESLNRLMSAVEHILVAHYLRYLCREDPTQLSTLGILVDGPLALFGQSAPFHRALMKLLADIRTELHLHGMTEPLVMGLSKTGRLSEHADMIDEILPAGALVPVTDEYRYSYIEPSKAGSTKNFGNDTYYGHDFIVKTERGHKFVLCLAYPFSNKSGDFQREKAIPNNYDNLGRALAVIKALESDLYGASMIPVVLAHQHASISITPGGKVLDILSKRALRGKT